MGTVALASALLALAALLAGLGASVRALSGVDGKARPALLSAGVGVGVLAAGIGVAPEVLGPGTFSIDSSTLTIFLGGVVVAAVDVVEVRPGAGVLVFVWASGGAL